MEREGQPVIACNLDALSTTERERRAALARAVVQQARSVQELTDGYALELPSTPSLAHESLEWLLLEHELEPEEGSLWLRLRGGPGVKEFLAAAGVVSRTTSAPARC